MYHVRVATFAQTHTADLLADKPEDTVEFAKEYFSTLNQQNLLNKYCRIPVVIPPLARLSLRPD
jgi:hypothetical protein